MAGWQCSHLVRKHPDKHGLECCRACHDEQESRIQGLKEEVQDNVDGADVRLAAVEERLEASYWRTAVWYARRKHIATCEKQLAEDREKAQELLDRNAQSNKRAEQKRKGRDAHNSSNHAVDAGKLNYYADYYDAYGDSTMPTPNVAMTRGQADGLTGAYETCACPDCNTNATTSAHSTDHHHHSYPQPASDPFAIDHNTSIPHITRNEEHDDWEYGDETKPPRLPSGSPLDPHSDDLDFEDDEDTSATYAGERNLSVHPPSSMHRTASRTRSRSPYARQDSHPVMSDAHAAQLLALPREQYRAASSEAGTSVASSSSMMMMMMDEDDTMSMPSIDESAGSIAAQDDSLELPQEQDTQMQHQQQEDENTSEHGYPLKLPFWVSAHLVVRHPASKDKETCAACLEALNAERQQLLNGAMDMSSEAVEARLAEIEQQTKDGYWLTNGNGRFRHMADCVHQTQDTRDKAKIRLDRYLAMARQRMKARHQREKEEKKRAKSEALGTSPAPPSSSSAIAAGGLKVPGTAVARGSSTERDTPEPLGRFKKVGQKKVHPVDEDLRALAIMPGKKGASAKGPKANLMNTYTPPIYTDDEADLADLPPPMLDDSGSERSPSLPPEHVKTPHSVSFRVTEEPFLLIRDSAPFKLLEGIDENSSFFAASAEMYASQRDSYKIHAHNFFDAPPDHHHSSTGLGARKRSPHLYMRRDRDEHKRRRVTPDLSRRALGPPRTVKRTRHFA